MHYVFKVTQIVNRHWWGDFHKIAETVNQQCLTRDVHHFRKPFLVPEASDFLCLDPLNTTQWEFPIRSSRAFVFWMCKLSPAARLMCSPAKETGGKCVSHLGFAVRDLQWWKQHPLRWVNHVKLMMLNIELPLYPSLQSSDKVKRTEILRLISELATTAELPWPQQMPLVLLTVHGSHLAKT